MPVQCASLFLFNLVYRIEPSLSYVNVRLCNFTSLQKWIYRPCNPTWHIQSPQVLLAWLAGNHRTNFFSDTNKRPSINTSDITKCQTIFHRYCHRLCCRLRYNSMEREIVRDIDVLLLLLFCVFQIKLKNRRNPPSFDTRDETRR